MPAIYRFSRRNGQIVVLLTLALSLVVNFGGVGLLGAFLALCAVTSAGHSIWESIRKFDRPYRMSDAGKTYVVIVLYAATSIFLTLYHRDDIGVLEPAIKQLVIAYAIFFHVDRRDVAVVFIGAALGAILASGAATYEYYYLGMERAEGATNAIRFGFIAALFGALSLIGLLFDCRSRGFAVVTAAGALAGMLAACLSGSIGTALAVPPMLLIIVARLWNQSRGRAASVVLIALVVFGAFMALDVGSMRTNIARIVDNFRMSYGAGTSAGDASFRARAKLLQISGQLFREHPLLGVGNNGWVAVVQEAGKSPELVETELSTLNQAHNQFVNDIAKGGVVGGLAGLALFFVPLFLFARSRPLSNDPLTVPALAGLVTCVGFVTIGLTESVLVLSLPAATYAVLLCFLMAAQQSSRRPARVHAPIGVASGAG